MVHKQVAHHLTPSLLQHTTTVISSKGSQHVSICVSTRMQNGKGQGKRVRDGDKTSKRKS